MTAAALAPCSNTGGSRYGSKAPKGDAVIAALYVSPDGYYTNRPDVDPWDEARDARGYTGQHPVVAHPPCQLWVNFAAVNWTRYGRQRPAWYAGGDDGGCFAHALWSVLTFGGVLEHPAGSHAWAAHELARPSGVGWSVHSTRFGERYWVCEVWQSAYGHRARKRTWLLYSGANPPAELNWSREAVHTHQVGWFDRNRPTVSKREANATPAAFAEALIQLACNARSV
jgi:hypothetical protein